MSTPCDLLHDDLDAIVDGDRDTIARHADHLATCDACRDARHEASQIATLVGAAGGDHVPADANGIVDRLLATIDGPSIAATTLPGIVAGAATRVDLPVAQAGLTTRPGVVAPAKRVTDTPARPAEVTPIRTAPRKRPWLGAAAAAAAIAATGTGIYVARHGGTDATAPLAQHDGSIGTLAAITRAAADHADGVSVRVGTAAWHPLRAHEQVPAGAELETDERTRTAIDLADGSHVVLDHLTTVAFDPADSRHVRLTAGRIVADVAHVDNRPAAIETPSGTIEVVGTRFEVTATDALTSVQVVRGQVILRDAHGDHEDVRAGEEGVIDHGALSVSAAPELSKEVAWSELAAPTNKPDEITAGVGALRAYKPGETRDRDWQLALAKHDVKVRIVGPIARTEITEVFRNDSATQLEGVYQFPLPADAQIDGLSLDVDGGFVDGAFVDKQRAAKIWRGVIDRSRPIEQRRTEEIVWVPGPWRDPALLDWKRGGRFELKIFPIPAKGSRTIKLAYTQVVAPRGPWREYIYPLPHSSDGSTVADQMSIDVEVRGAMPGLVRTTGYALAPDPTRSAVNAMTFQQGGFVPRGDLVVDYRATDGDAELRAWTFTGGAAVAPDDKLAAKKGVGIDPKVVDVQRLVAGDARPTAVLALQPKLPRWKESKPRDYVIVVDDSQSMVGERFTRGSDLAVSLIDQMDRRDRFTTMLCDSECRSFGAVRAPSAGAATELRTWLKTQPAAGATDLVASVRAAAAELGDPSRERWVLYVGDGFASTGFRRVADVEHAIADSTATKDIHVTTIGIGSDADEPVLSAVARGGGGSYLAWLPGQTITATAALSLETTYGASLRDAKLTLPSGLADVAPTILPTVRAGQEVLIAARVSGDVSGDVILQGTVAGQPFEQHYPLKLAVSSAAGNGFVPRLWASLAIDDLERAGRGEDRARMVALSQGYGVMSRETSLLVLESAAMFDAFGVDRNVPTAKWTGEDSLDEVSTGGTMQVADDATAKPSTPRAISAQTDEPGGDKNMAKADKRPYDRSPPAPAMTPPMGHGSGAGFGNGAGGVGMSTMSSRRNMIAMHQVWTRVAAVSPYDGVNPSITKSIADYEDALLKSPDSREKHRALVQALSYAGEIAKATDIANRWLERDRLDPQALGYLADLAGRNGERDQSLRTLAGLVDLDADRVALHERMVNAYERAGRLAQACGHRIAIASIQQKDAASAGAAARCLRTLGREHDADLVMRDLPDDASRATAEKLATVAAIVPRVAGDLVVNAKWDAGADLDLSLVTPDGTRVSWMGGRSDVIVADTTASDREELAVRSLRRGNYLIEITRGDVGRSTVRGSLDVTVLGVHKTLPFELTGPRAVVGRIAITLESHLEAIDGSGFAINTPVPAPRVTISPISDEQMNVVVHARAGVFRACYQRALATDPSASGRVTLVISVDANGNGVIQRANASSDSLSSVSSCITSNVARLRFPQGAATTFAVAFDLRPN